MRIARMFEDWIKERRAIRRLVMEDAAELMNEYGCGAYGESSRRAAAEINGNGLHGRPKGHWSIVKLTIGRIEGIF